MEANNEAAKETLTPIAKQRKVSLFSADPRVTDARRAVEEATRHLDDNNCAYIQAKENLSRTYDEVLAEDLARKVRQAEACSNNNQHSAGWMLVREIAGDRSSSPGQIDGETEEDRVNSWYCHFKNLLGNPLMVQDEDEEIEPVFHDLPINDGPFTLDEYREAKQSLRPGKSCGEDWVYSEVLRWVNIDDLILGICNRVLEHRELPGQWTISNIIPIPKAGDLRNRDDYRGTSLCSVVAKAYNKTMLYKTAPRPSSATKPELMVSGKGDLLLRKCLRLDASSRG